MSLVYRSLCNEIDDVVITLLNLQEKYISYKIKLEQVMEEGYINIAKARYIMGNRCVSALQLPTQESCEFRPSSTLCRAEYKGHNVYKLQTHKYKSNITNIEDELLGEYEIDTRRESNDTLKQAPMIVKDRDYDTVKGKVDGGSIDFESDQSKSSIIDPIKWFGVLVPQTLRTAQDDFTNALVVISKIGTLHSELTTVMARLRHLLEVKMIVEVATEPLELDIYVKKYYGSAKPSITLVDDKGDEEQEEGSRVESIATHKGKELIGEASSPHVEYILPQEDAESQVSTVVIETKSSITKDIEVNPEELDNF